MMERPYRFIFQLLLTVGILGMSMPVWALKTVAKTGGDFNTITAALAAAAAGEEVRITDQATYSESLNINNGNLIVSNPAGAVLDIGGNWNHFWGGTATLRGLTISGSGVQINTAVAGGTLNLDNVTFSGSSYALHLSNQVTLNITGCTFAGNWQSIYIDASHQVDSVINISDSTFTGIPGHVIDIHRPTKLSITNSIVTSTGNRGISFGDASAAGTYELTLNGAQIKNCGSDGVFIGQPAKVVIGAGTVVSNNGGVGLMWQPTVDGGTLSANQAQFNTNGNKGVFLANNLTSTFTQCTFSNNTDTGLVRYQENTPSVDTHITLESCTLTGNAGFGIWAPAKTRSAFWTLNHNTFQSNGVGGLALGSDSSLTNVSLEANGNKFVGLTSNAQPQVSLSYLIAGSRFVNNLIDGGSNGVVLTNGYGELLHNTVVNENANAVVLGQGLVTVRLLNNLFAAVGTGAAAETGASLAGVVLNYNLVEATSQAFDSAVAAIAGINNITNKPAAFVSASATPGSGDYHLSINSGADGAGDETLGILMDLENQSRPNPAGSAPDLGAYESAYLPVSLSEFAVN